MKKTLSPLSLVILLVLTVTPSKLIIYAIIMHTRRKIQNHPIGLSPFKHSNMAAGNQWKQCSTEKASGMRDTCTSIERFRIAFTANGKRQAEISRLPKTREIYLVSVYILPVSHSYGASTKTREISWNEIIFLLLRQAGACRLPFAVGRKREAKSL